MGKLRIFLLASLLATGQAGSEEFALAHIGGETVTIEQFYGYLQQLNPRLNYGALPPAEQERLLREYVAQRLQADRALAGGLHESPETKARLAFFRQRVLAEAYRDQVMKSVKVSEAEISNDYQSNRPLYAIAPRLLIEHVVYRLPEQAIAAQHHLSAGGDWDDLAAQRATAEGPVFAERNEFTPDILLPALRETVLELAETQTSELVHSAYGYHVVRLVKRTPGGFQPLEQVRAAIESRLRQRKAAEILESIVDEQVRDGAVQLNLHQAREKGRLD